MSMYSDVLAVPLTIGFFLVLSLIYNFIQYNKIQHYKQIGGDIFLVKEQCARDNVPMGIMNDKSNSAMPFVCNISEKNDWLTDGPKPNRKQKTNLSLITPQAAQTQNQIDIRGLGKVSIFQMPYHFPQDIRSSAALVNFGQAIEKDPYLSKFRNTLKMMMLCWCRNADFRTECRKYISYAVQFNIENGHSIDIPFKPRNKKED